MRAIILAAGRGSRMKEKTAVLPKCLTKLWGKTLLEWQIKAIADGGINDIAVITGYKSDEIRKHQPNLTYFHNDDWETTNMVATLLKADAWLSTDECIVSYSDIIYTSKAISLLAEDCHDISLTYYTKFLELWEQRFANPLDDIETFKIDNDFNLIEIGQKATIMTEIEGQYMGLLKFSPVGYKQINDAIQAGLPKPMK